MKAAARPRWPARPWAAPAAQVLSELGVRPEAGLSAAQVRDRRRLYGRNRLKQKRRVSAWRVLANQFASVMMALLAAAAVLSFAFADRADGTAILLVLALNAAIGFATELRAVRSMEALGRLAQVDARVRRDAHVSAVPAEQLVPGDVVVLEAGDVISADLRVIEASRLAADESALTGESMPVPKSSVPVEAAAMPAERACMLHKGTSLTRGSGEAVVVATGLATELGRISGLVLEAERSATPLERRLERLGRRLIWVTLGLTALLAAGGILAGRDALLMVEVAVALAVATVPEGLPVVATVALARGMWRLARRNALVNRLAAVETLGATGVICTDKTGTLTENRMTAVRLVLPDGEVEVRRERGRWAFAREGRALDPRQAGALRMAIETGVLCSNATLRPGREAGGAPAQAAPQAGWVQEPAGTAEHAAGDPLEVALLALGEAAGISRGALLRREPETREEAFDTQTRMMATFHRVDRGWRVAVKGAPEAVLAACSREHGPEGGRPLEARARERWLARNDALAAEGLRVLALATRTVDSAQAPPYEELELLGLVGLLDPPREDVRAAIGECRAAGIRVVMVTGDHPATARTVALAVGLTDAAQAEVIEGSELEPADAMPEEARERVRRAAIFARVTPEQKLDLIGLHQRANAVVAMTGDGVNDAPALRKADIGIAMGRRGTQVAREAADMVLKDDAFATIVAAVRHGRVIFANIRKFVLYLMSCNASEVLVVGLAAGADAPLPLLPLQILFLNLVTDVFPALALGVGPGDPSVMREAPRPADEPILTRRHWIGILTHGAVITAAVLGAFAAAIAGLGMDPPRAVTVSFLALAFAQLWHVFNMRDTGSGALVNDVTRNAFVWAALALCTALLLAAVYAPWLRTLLALDDPGPAGWTLALGASLVPLAFGQSLKAARLL